ncbi:unnamed protein product [Symbiodinium sp. CCMP2592]|nr:unnamed protein product [Symbiodinium sp. CCMP2592]
MKDSRSSSYVIREAILKFYDDKKLWPRGITSAMECIQVLDRLPSALAPAPVPLITEQYAKAMKDCADDDDDDDECDEEANVASASELKDAVEDKSMCTPPKQPAGYRFKVEIVNKEAKRKAKNPTSKKPEKAASDPEAPDHHYGDYLPKDFCKKGKEFRDRAKADGHSPKEALRMWMESEERASILADVPLNELKRRKFVPKGCDQNPFARNARLRGASVDIVNDQVLMDLLTPDLIDTITEKAGFMSREEMGQFMQKTAVHFVDIHGVKRHTGKPKALQKSQEYTKEFGDFLAKYFVDVMQAEMPNIIGYLNAKHVQPPGQWETWPGRSLRLSRWSGSISQSLSISLSLSRSLSISLETELCLSL